MNQIYIEKNDDKFSGIFHVVDDLIYVFSVYGKKVTQLGNSNPESLAKLLLTELINEQISF